MMRILPKKEMSSLRLHGNRFSQLHALFFIIFSCAAATSSLPRAATPHKPTLANEYECLQADRPVDIVLSHYKEDLNIVRSKLERLRSHPFIARGRGCVHLYTKSSKSFALAADKGASGLNETVVVKTHNLGRESGAYLHYIVSNYHNLPRHAIFLQAEVEEIDKVLVIMNRATEQTGFLGLGIWSTCTCDNCNLIPGKLVRIREVWALATGTLCLRDFKANFRGQMLVSRERIRRHRPDFYLLLQRSLFAQPGHVLHEDVRYVDESEFRRDMQRVVDSQGAHDSLFGHVMERMWSVVFDCYDEDAHNGCSN